MVYKREKLDTIGKVFEKALEIAKYYPENADEFFDEYIHHIMECERLNKQEAIGRARANLGYFAGYYGSNICHLMGKIYGAYHPIFG